MREQGVRGVWVLANGLAIVLGGSLVGFFFVGPIVLADGPFTERLFGVAIGAVLYLVLGMLAGWLTGSWVSGIWLAVPGVLVAFLLSDQLLLMSLGIAAVLPASLLGAYVGALLRRKSRASRALP